MSSAWRKTLVYLGLVEEPEMHDEAPRHNGTGVSVPTARGPEPRPGNVRPLRAAVPDGPALQTVTIPDEHPDVAREVVVVGVRRFDDSERIGATYRDGHPVLFDLSEVDRKVARRVLDFVAGMTYALGGRLTSAGSLAFLLVPAGVDVSRAEQRRLASLGYGSDA